MQKLFFIALVLFSISFPISSKAQSLPNSTFQFSTAKTKTEREINLWLTSLWTLNDSIPFVVIKVHKNIKDERDAIRQLTLYSIECHINDSYRILYVYDRSKLLVAEYNKNTPDKKNRYHIDFDYTSCKSKKCENYQLKMHTFQENPFTSAQSKQLISAAIKELKQGTSNPIFTHYDRNGVKNENCCDEISLDNYLFTVDYSEQ